MADEFAEKLNAVLGNPEAMGQIMSIAQALTGGGSPDEQTSPPQEAQETSYEPIEPTPTPEPLAPVPPSQPQAQSIPDLSGILNLLGGLSGGASGGGNATQSGGNPLSALSELDPRFLQLGMRLLTEYNGTDDRKTALLAALRPFVKEERFAKIDKAIQIAKLSRVIRVAFQVFKEGGEKDDV